MLLLLLLLLLLLILRKGSPVMFLDSCVVTVFCNCGTLPVRHKIYAMCEREHYSLLGSRCLQSSNIPLDLYKIPTAGRTMAMLGCLEVTLQALTKASVRFLEIHCPHKGGVSLWRSNDATVPVAGDPWNNKGSASCWRCMEIQGQCQL